MIRLNYNPVVGSSVPIQLSFRDDFGKYYVPTVINYTVLAMNNNEADWQIVDKLQCVPLKSASQVNFSVTATKQIPDTTMDRKVIVQWKAVFGGQLTDFIEEIDFTLNPYPVITNEGSPANPPAPTPLPEPTCTVKQEIKGGVLVNYIVLRFPAPMDSTIKTVMIDAQGYEGEWDTSSTILTVPLEDLEEGTYSVSSDEFKTLSGDDYDEFELDFTIVGITTADIKLKNKDEESLSGTALTLSDALKEMVVKIKELEGTNNPPQVTYTEVDRTTYVPQSSVPNFYIQSGSGYTMTMADDYNLVNGNYELKDNVTYYTRN